MKLTKEHLFKEVINRHGQRGWFVGLDGMVCISSQNGATWGGTRTWMENDGWELVPEKKKPSDRIKEISAQINGGCWDLRSGEQAICQYLDELEESK